jgi:hypothetical protein
MVLQMVIFVIFSSLVMAQKMSWGDNMNLETEDNITYLVVMVGEDADLVCQVQKAGRKIVGNMKWSKNGNLLGNKARVTKANSNGMTKSYFHLGNVTLDMNGMTLQCRYEETVLIDGYRSHSYWAEEATMAVFNYAGENMGQVGGSVRNRMEQKIRIMKNIVASNPDLKIKANVTDVTIDERKSAAPCSNAWKIEGCSWILMALIFTVKWSVM